MIRTPLIVLASVVMLGCSEHTWPTTPDPKNAQPPIIAGSVEFTGTVVVEEAGGVYLQRSDGNLILLVGNEAARIASVAGGEILVRGTLDASPGMVVESFQVLAMNGRPALDGIVEDTEEGLALRLVDGTFRSLTQETEALGALIGERLWITGLDEPPVEYGVIDAK